MADHSVVEYYKERDGYRCGYCGQSDTNHSNGMWAHTLTCEDYQDLIDRGWRRSGKYCYKPIMNVTCCPPYTIRCGALEFKASKSQKKVIKQFNKYLTTSESKTSEKESKETKQSDSSGVSPVVTTEASSSSTTKQNKKQPKPGLGADANKPLCRKAKTQRMERKQQKLTTDTASKGSKQNHEKTLEELLLEYTHHENPVHKLETKIVLADMSSEEFRKTFKVSHRLYQKYQVAIHKDTPDKVNERQFQRFLIDSPLKHTKGPGAPSMGYGSFHQQYYLDGVLIAIGVLDILPRSISSVYLFYDPDYGFLSPGVYSALREIYFTQQLYTESPSIEYYYMGFYIHSCPKMKYKGNYYPSYLVCPETYNWVPIKDCIPKIDVNKYSRLDDNAAVPPSTDINTVMVLHDRQAMQFPIYVIVKTRTEDDDSSDSDEEESSIDIDTDGVQEYANLIGPVVATRMLLYRP